MLSRSSPVLFIVALAALLGTQAHEQFADPDLWGRLSSAALWFGAGHFPYTDPLSFTAAGRPWIDHEWLSGAAFYGALRAGGEAGLLLLKDAILAACIGCVFWIHRKIYGRSGLWALAGLVVLSPLLDLAFAATVRSQVFSFLFFLVFLIILESVRIGRAPARALAVLIPLGALWANLHGGFVLGALAALAYGVGAAWERRMRSAALPYIGAVLGLFAALAFLNPYGPRYLRFLAMAWTLDRSDIIEWGPLWSTFSGERVGIAATAAVALYLAARAARARKLTGPALSLLLLVALALRAYRFKTFLVWGLLALAPAFTSLLPAKLAERGSYWMAGAGARLTDRFVLLVAILAAITLASAGSHPLTAPLLPQLFPVAQIEALRAAGASGNLITPFVSGEFAEWALYPRMHAEIDGRFEEVFSLDETREWLHFFRANNEDRQLAQRARDHGANWIIVPATAPATARALTESPLWRRVLREDGFSLFAGPGAGALPPDANSSSEEEAPERTIADFFTDADLERFSISVDHAS